MRQVHAPLSDIAVECPGPRSEVANTILQLDRRMSKIMQHEDYINGEEGN